MCVFDLISVLKITFFFFWQDEKNQVLTTNIWLRMVRILERLSVFGAIMIFFFSLSSLLPWAELSV